MKVVPSLDFVVSEVNVMNQLLTSFCGITLENPCLLSAAPPTRKKEGIAAAFRLGWAGAVTKTCTAHNLIAGDTPRRFAVLRGRAGDITGFENIEGLSHYPISYWEQVVGELKEEFPTKAIIASIMGDSRKESWQDLAQRMEAAGADALELNLSCPHFRTDQGMGAATGKSADLSADITAWVKEVTSIPIIVKLTPNVSDIGEIARAAVHAGADALSAINTVQALMGVDIDTFEPLPSVDGYSAFGGYSGPAIKPIGLRCVAQLAQTVRVPIHGIGGITTWQNVVEYMAVGASCVQVCTAVMLNGYGIIKPILAGLQDYVARKGIEKLSGITGTALTKITAREKLNMNWGVRSALVRPEACIKCGRCATVCGESGKAAITFSDGIVTVVDRAICDGCSLCTHVCPSKVLALI